MPPLIGWAAAAGHLNVEAWSLYALLFFWQFPHFMAIAWMYREDYSRAGYLVLPRGALKSSVMAVQSVLPCLILLAASLILLFTAHSHIPYWVANLLLASLFLFCAGRLAFQRSNASAKRLLSVSIIYLPLVFCVVLLSRF
jgi:protoheme IX farnesyltransferase